MNHRHAATKQSTDRPFRGPVAQIGGKGGGYNPAAHGGVEYTETCSCGWERLVLQNQSHGEHSAWYDPSIKPAPPEDVNARIARELEARQRAFSGTAPPSR